MAARKNAPRFKAVQYVASLCLTCAAPQMRRKGQKQRSHGLRCDAHWNRKAARARGLVEPWSKATELAGLTEELPTLLFDRTRTPRTLHNQRWAPLWAVAYDAYLCAARGPRHLTQELRHRRNRVAQLQRVAKDPAEQERILAFLALEGTLDLVREE